LNEVEANVVEGSWTYRHPYRSYPWC